MEPIGHIGVFTSGGDAPGMNAAIRAVVRTAVFNGMKVSGIVGGYEGMVRGALRPLGARDVSNIVQRGGTILRSSRSEAFRTEKGRATAVAELRAAGIDALVAIGGNGTQAGALALHREHGVRVMGVASTIDNDLGGTDRSIGFDTACNTAVEAIDRIRDTASSHERVFFVEVMGRDSGSIALRCAIAAGAEFAMVPERRESLDALIGALSNTPNTKTSSIVVVAEGDEEGGAFALARKVRERLPRLDIRVTVLGHLQRGGAPTVSDRELASRLGVAAVEALIAGRSAELTGMVNGGIAFTPLEQAVGGARPMDEDLFRILSILAI